MKKIAFSTLAFLVGLGISMKLDIYFRRIIQNIFHWSTDKIQFVGKNIFFFHSPFYYILFGITGVVLYLNNQDKKLPSILKNLIAFLAIFSLSVVAISFISAHLEVMNCTLCDDGILKLKWNDINYSIILELSILLASIPSIYSILKRNRTN